jgi:hypothetical protein
LPSAVAMAQTKAAPMRSKETVIMFTSLSSQ